MYSRMFHVNDLFPYTPALGRRYIATYSTPGVGHMSIDTFAVDFDLVPFEAAACAASNSPAVSREENPGRDPHKRHPADARHSHLSSTCRAIVVAGSAGPIDKTRPLRRREGQEKPTHTLRQPLHGMERPAHG